MWSSCSIGGYKVWSQMCSVAMCRLASSEGHFCRGRCINHDSLLVVQRPLDNGYFILLDEDQITTPSDLQCQI